jgi:hypothetical protein
MKGIATAKAAGKEGGLDGTVNKRWRGMSRSDVYQRFSRLCQPCVNPELGRNLETGQSVEKTRDRKQSMCKSWTDDPRS